MDINIVLESVESTINKYKNAFPDLVKYASIEQYKNETLEAIFAYDKKATLISKDLLQKELEKFLITGKEFFDEGFHKGSKEGKANNLLIGMLEMAWIEAFLKQMNTFHTEETETNTDNLKIVLGKYGFFELNKVKSLSESSKIKLVELLSKNDLPYCVAMFDFLDFLNYLRKEHISTKDTLNKEISKWFNSDKDGRAVKGNINTLSEYSNENRQKYTAHLHKKTVIKEYEELK